MNDFDQTELAALRSELLLRSAIQNGTIILLAPMLLVATWIALEHSQRAQFVYLVHTITVGMAALNWCHHDVRISQVRGFLLLLEQRHCSGVGWESWLPAHRIGGLLGSRWFISTKGVFVGSQIVGAAGGYLLADLSVSPLLILSVLATTVTGALLLTNPKMRT